MLSILDDLNINKTDYKSIISFSNDEEIFFLLINDNNEEEITNRIIDGKYVTVICLSLNNSPLICKNPHFLKMIEYLVKYGYRWKDTDNFVNKLLDSIHDYRLVDFDKLKRDIAEKYFMFQGSIIDPL